MPSETKVMTAREVRAEQERDIANWFKDHVATYSEGVVGGVRVERIVWKRPNDGFYRVDYTCIGGTTLCVAGDIGEAVYNTGADSLKWWVRCDLDYFASKCYASEDGRGFKEWDADVAEARLREEVERHRNEGYGDISADAVEDAASAIRGGRGEWDEWMRERGAEMFGAEWWDFVPSFGIVVALRCAGHLTGLKMALRSLATSPTDEKTNAEAAKE